MLPLPTPVTPGMLLRGFYRSEFAQWHVDGTTGRLKFPILRRKVNFAKPDALAQRFLALLSSALRSLRKSTPDRDPEYGIVLSSESF